MLGPDVMLFALVVPAVVPVTLVDGASVTLTVDSGSTTSGLTARCDVEGGGGPEGVPGGSWVANGGTMGGRVGAPGAGGAFDKVVCVVTVGVETVTLAVGPVGGAVEDPVEVLLMGVVEATVTEVVAEVTAAEVS